MTHKKISKIILGAFLFSAVYSCSRYYMPVKQNVNSADESASVISEKTPGKYIILHKGNKVYQLENISVDKAKLTMSGNLTGVDPTHLLYVKAKHKKYKYSEKDNVVLNEVHVYVDSTAAIDTASTLVLPLNQIQKIEVIEHDKQRTTTSYVLGGIGIGVGAIVVTGVIVLLTKESCPYLSVYDGDQFVLQGELFGGAINSQLSRMDYVPLKATPQNGEFKIRLSNELKEKQYTDFADLIVIEHPEGSNVLPNADGKLYMVRHPETPQIALLNNKKDVLHSVTAIDNKFCTFNDTSVSSGINELLLTFKKSTGITKGKLLLDLKNSYWLDYLYGEFARHFGDDYEAWRKKQLHEPASEMNLWSEKQQIPLTISVETKNGWKEIQKLKTIGPLENRSIVIPFESGDTAAQTVNIKLICGFQFWEVDYAGVDFSSDQPIQVTRLKPSSAVDKNGKSVLPALMQNDKKYLAQPKAGDYAILTYRFNQQPTSGNTFSVVLQTSGYYEPIREYTGKPDISFLKKFRDDGYFSKFSRTQFQKMINEQSIATAETK